MATRMLLFATGVTAWLGGLVTAFAVSSCDVDTCELDPDAPSCTPPYPAGLDVEEPDASELPLRDPAAAPSCDRMARPSVYVMPARRIGDMVRVVDVDAVWFEHEGRTYEARCIQGEVGCAAWVAGTELEGRITVSTEYCDTVVSESVDVERTPDGCHVATEFLLLDVSTLGCLVDQPPPDGPPPGSPWRETLAG